MWGALIMAWLGVVACSFVTEPVEMDRADWIDLVGDPSMANVHNKIKPGMPGALKEVFKAVKQQPLGAGDLFSRYSMPDFAVDDKETKTIIATHNAIAVSNTNSPGYTQGMVKSASVQNFTTFTHTRLESKIEFVTDAKVSMCHDLPFVGCQKYIDRVVRVHLNISGTIPILAALILSEPRVELFDGKQGVVFNFNASLTTGSVTWEGTGVMAETATCEITVAGARFRLCSKIEGIFHRRTLERNKDLAITQVATEKMVLAFEEHIRAAVGHTVTVPVNVISPSVFVS